MSLSLSVIICTHNPRLEYLHAVLESIRCQEPLEFGQSWELLLIDNASTFPLQEQIDLHWHLNSRILREDTLGLTPARLRSFREARGEIILYVDDDNILSPNYFRETLAAFEANSSIGAIGGKSIARYETAPPAWFLGLEISLACRDLGDATLMAAWPVPLSPSREYPLCAPIGAGMAIRRSAYAAYIESVATDLTRQALGRRGHDLTSGEDNDIVLTLLERGWSVAYLPQLRLEHLIPATRLTSEYLARYAYSTNRTWVQVLDVHGLRPWSSIDAWTVPIRKARAFVRQRSWKSPKNRIQWRGMCGLIDGRSAISKSG